MEFGEIVYHIADAHQFWAELGDTLSISPMSSLDILDATLRQFISFCASFHQQYLQTPIQLDHACTLLLNSDLFCTHSDRISNLLISDALTTTDPHVQLILHNVLLLHGRQHLSFFRSSKKWGQLIPILMDHIVLGNFDAWSTGTGSNSATNNQNHGWVAVPIEARLRVLAVGILYEVCRVQKFDMAKLEVLFSEEFVEQLFEMVESTRDDETLSYCLIRLIIALNEQFMVAALPANKDDLKENASSENRVIRVLMRRLGSSKTFGENLIFMLNRADGSAEDRCMQLLVLKILYLLFTTPGTQEYFYTNDLCVLVDVFLRELDDLDEHNESLRHTYLRVLHPLLTHTQLRTLSYKRPQILRTLESLIAHAHIRDVCPTTKRLVERCLSGEWAVQLMKERDAAMSVSLLGKKMETVTSTPPSPSEGSSADFTTDTAANSLGVNGKHPLKDLRFSKSVDILTLKSSRRDTSPSSAVSASRLPLHDVSPRKPKFKSDLNQKKLLVMTSAAEHRRGSTDSSMSFMSVAGAATTGDRGVHGRPYSTSPPPRALRSPLADSDTGASVEASASARAHTHSLPPRASSGSTSDLPNSTVSVSGSSSSSSSFSTTQSRLSLSTTIIPSTPIFEDPPELLLHAPLQQHSSPSKRRPAPAPPAQRQKPPVPSRSLKAVFRSGTAGDQRSSGGGVSVTTIASSVATVGKSVIGLGR